MKFSSLTLTLDAAQQHLDAAKEQYERTKTLELILSITKRLNRTLDLEEVLSLVLKSAITLTHSERGFIVLKNIKNQLEFAVGLNAENEPLSGDAFQVSTTVVEDVFHTGLARFIEDAQGDTNNDITKSILYLDLKTILCAPLIAGDKKIGVIYLDSKLLNKIRIKEITYAFEILAGQAAIAIQNAQIFKQQTDANKELLRVNTELNEARLMAENSSRFKSSLMRNLNHEFRTPLNGILGLGGILKETLQEKEKIDLIERILNASQRLLKTLTEILDLSDLESSNLHLDDSTIQISNVLESIAASASMQAKAKRLDFWISVKNDFFVKFDERYVQQLLESLIENAVKFTTAGFVKITVDIENGKGVLIVSDSGIGILPDLKETIFEAFKQVSEGFDRSYEGCGLGLTLVKKIVDLAGGTISVESSVGVGTSFIVTLPIAKAPQHYTAEPSSSIQKLQLQQKTGVQPNILLVEDDESNLETFRMFLRNEADIDVAVTPHQAMRLASAKNYDLVFIDIKLNNNQNGVELMKEIKKNNAYDKIPFIATTGFTLREDKARFLSEGFSEFLAKPFTPAELKDVIRKLSSVQEPAI